MNAGLATTVVIAFRSSWSIVTDTELLIGVLSATSALPQYLMTAMLDGAVCVAQTVDAIARGREQGAASRCGVSSGGGPDGRTLNCRVAPRVRRPQHPPTLNFTPSFASAPGRGARMCWIQDRDTERSRVRTTHGGGGGARRGLLISLLVVPVVAAAAAPPPWGHAGADARRTRRSVAPIAFPDSLRWAVGGAPSAVATSALIDAMGTSYLSAGARFLAIAANGTTLWSAASFGPASPCLSVNGSVFVMSGTALFALSPSGVVVWAVDVSGMNGSSPALSPDGATVYAAVSGGLAAHAASSGALRWLVASSGGTTTPAVDISGSVVFGAAGGAVVKLSPGGAVVWNVSIGGAGAAAPVIGDDGTVFAATQGGDVVALRGADGSQEWRAALGGGGPAAALPSVAIGTAGAVYVVTGGGATLVSLNATSGALHWAAVMPNGSAASPVAVGPPNAAVGGGESVMFGTSTGAIVALAGATGAALWRASVSGSAVVSVAVAGDGAVVVSIADGSVACVGPAVPPPASSPSATLTGSATPWAASTAPTPLSPTPSTSASQQTTAGAGPTPAQTPSQAATPPSVSSGSATPTTHPTSTPTAPPPPLAGPHAPSPEQRRAYVVMGVCLGLGVPAAVIVYGFLSRPRGGHGGGVMTSRPPATLPGIGGADARIRATLRVPPPPDGPSAPTVAFAPMYVRR